MQNQTRMNSQPTISEVANAFKVAKESQDVEDANQLRYLRDNRYSWYGAEELLLRYEIDKYLGVCICSDGPFHYESCPQYDANRMNPFEELGKRMSELGNKK